MCVKPWYPWKRLRRYQQISNFTWLSRLIITKSYWVEVCWVQWYYWLVNAYKFTNYCQFHNTFKYVMPTLQQTQFLFEFLAWFPRIMLLMYMLLNEQRYVYVNMLYILKHTCMCLNLNGEKYLLLKDPTTLSFIIQLNSALRQ